MEKILVAVKDLTSSREEKTISGIQKYILAALSIHPSLLATQGSLIFKFINSAKGPELVSRFKVSCSGTVDAEAGCRAETELY